MFLLQVVSYHTPPSIIFMYKEIPGKVSPTLLQRAITSHRTRVRIRKPETRTSINPDPVFDTRIPSLWSLDLSISIDVVTVLDGDTLGLPTVS